MPTVQMVFRRSLQHVTSRDDYFSGDAHPAAFEGYDDQPRPHGQPRQLDRAPTRSRRRCASACSRRTSAPRASTTSATASPSSSSTRPRPSPASGARRPARRTMIVSAAETRDPNGRPLDLRLAPAAGRPGEGHDRARSSDGRQRADHARLARPLPRSPRTTRSSPPASTSASSPTTACTTAPRRSSAGTSRRTRRAATRPARTARRASSRSTTPTRPAETYADPMLVPRADWRDDYRYDADGTPHRLDPHPRGARARGLHRRRRPHPRPRRRRPPVARRGRRLSARAGTPTAGSWSRSFRAGRALHRSYAGPAARRLEPTDPRSRA